MSEVSLNDLSSLLINVAVTLRAVCLMSSNDPDPLKQANNRFLRQQADILTMCLKPFRADLPAGDKANS